MSEGIDELLQVMKLRRVMVVEVWLQTKVYIVSLTLVISENCWGLLRLPIFPILWVEAGPVIPWGISSLNNICPLKLKRSMNPLVCPQSLISMIPMASVPHTLPRFVQTGLFNREEPKFPLLRVLLTAFTTKQ